MTLLHGDGGLGKSLLAQLIARSVAGGSAVLERGTLKGRVVIIDGENPESEIARRLHGLQFGDVADQLTYIRASEPFLAAADAEQVLTDTRQGCRPRCPRLATRVMGWRRTRSPRSPRRST